jgi:hypothetical protein
VGLKRGPLSLVSTIEELLGRKSIISGREIREYNRRDRHSDHMATSLSEKGVTNFSDKGRSLGRYSSLADSGHGAFSHRNIFIVPEGVPDLQSNQLNSL